MDQTEAPAVRRKPPANGYSPPLPPPRHVSTLPFPPLSRMRRVSDSAGRMSRLALSPCILWPSLPPYEVPATLRGRRPEAGDYGAQWLACVFPCQPFRRAPAATPP